MSKLILLPESIELRDNRDSLVCTFELKTKLTPETVVIRKRRQRGFVYTFFDPYMTFYNVDVVEWRGIPGQMPTIRELEGMTR